MSRDAVFLDLIARILGVLVLAVLALVWLVRLLIRTVNSGGTWAHLAARYATHAPPPEGVTRGETIKIGAVVYRNCVTLAASDGGLYLAAPRVWPLRPKSPLLIPWSALRLGPPARLYWRSAARLRVDAPTPVDIILPEAVFTDLRRWIAAAG